MKLSAYLAAKKLTQQQFAEQVDCTQGRISQLLAGGVPSLPLAQAIAKATVGDVGLADWPEPDTPREAA